MDNKLLLIGEKSFCRIREGECHHVVKSACIGRSMRKGSFSFQQSIARGFTMTLFRGTMKEAFGGCMEMFDLLGLNNKRE